MFNKILFSIGLTLFSFLSIAQNKNVHHVGSSAGVTTGIGLSYRYWPTKFGFQVTALPTLIQNETSITSLGASLLYTLNDADKIDLYSYFGNSIFLGYHNSEAEIIYNLGVGFGIKFDIFEDLNFNTQFGYGVMNITNESSTFNIVGETGLYYHF